VTGAGRGIGRAVAEQLGAVGVAVALVARTQSELDEVAEAIVGAGGRAIALSADVAEADEIARVVTESTRQLGVIDILINNAAIIGPLGSFAKIDLDEWVYADAINVLAPVRFTHALLPAMFDAGWGRIVNVSTGAVNNPKRDDTYNAYIATKSALEGHTLNLAAELEGSGVTVNGFRPGIVDTSMQTQIRSQDPQRIGAAFHQKFLQRFLDGQLTSPDVPARVLLEMLEGDQNGEIVSARVPEAKKS
jgi:3-oxoacyl-[acyl-carrier protein] reductase